MSNSIGSTPRPLRIPSPSPPPSTSSSEGFSVFGLEDTVSYVLLVGLVGLPLLCLLALAYKVLPKLTERSSRVSDQRNEDMCSAARFLQRGVVAGFGTTQDNSDPGSVNTTREQARMAAQEQQRNVEQTLFHT